jgi:hypothetical protein
MWIWYIFILVQKIGCQIIYKHLEKFKTFKSKIYCCNINYLDRLLILVIFLYHNPYHSLTSRWTFVYCPLLPCSSRVHLQAFVLFLEALGGGSTSTFFQQYLSNDVLIEPIHGDLRGEGCLKKESCNEICKCETCYPRAWTPTPNKSSYFLGLTVETH